MKLGNTNTFKALNWNYILLLLLLSFSACSTKDDDIPPPELLGRWDVITRVYENPDGSYDYTSEDGKGGTIWIFDDGGVSYETKYGNGFGITTGEAYKYHDGIINFFLSGRHRIVKVNSTNLHLISLDNENGDTHIHFERDME